MSVTIAVLRATRAGERRVALTPDMTGRLVKSGSVVEVESDAGADAGFADASYEEAGATITRDAVVAVGRADIILCVHAPADAILDAVTDHGLLIGMLSPLADQPTIEQIARHGVTSMAMELIPRISRAQSMDVLSSMSTIAGNLAVIRAADRLDKIFPMLMTAAGTIAPARVLVLGAGVAGLQAIATARRLGAVVSAFDTRAVVKEQVESLGATFLAIEVGADAEAAGGYARELTADELRRQNELVADHIARSDVVITTALVPGRPAPVLIPTSTVERMRSGSVIIDMASEAGGNCELTRHADEVVHGGVRIIGPDNLPSAAPVHASQLYARNLTNIIELIVTDGALLLDDDDEIVAGTIATRGGEVVHPLLRERYGLPPAVIAGADAEEKQP